MSGHARRILLVERDSTGRALMDRALGGNQIAADAVAAVKDAEERLDRGDYALAIVDELAGTGTLLDELRTVRARWPRLPVIATGTILSARELLELLRLGVYEALPKPFLPDELRAAVERCLVRATPGEETSLDYAAALGAAREALGALALGRAASTLRRAHALAPLDPEVVTLDALRAELAGEDADADRWYRAALALRDDAGAPPPDPREGLARLAAYAGLARAAAPRTLGPTWTAWLPDALEPSARGPEPPRPWVILTTIGLTPSDGAPIHLRAGDDRAIAASLGDERPETIAAMMRALGATTVHASEAARRRFGVDRVDALLRGAA